MKKSTVWKKIEVLKMSKKTKIIIISSIAALAVILFVGIIVTIVGVTGAIAAKNRSVANKVVAQIDQLDDRPITLESESMLIALKAEYDLLTDKQKGMVSNYGVLQQAFKDLEHLKDKKVADELSAEIRRIDKSALTATNTTVEALMDKYKALTKEQKKLVENYDFLLECKSIVNEKIVEKQRIDQAKDLAQSFPGYDGTWGNFGSAQDDYQGMIETVIKKDVNYKNFFKAPVNSLKFYVSRFERTYNVFGIGECYFSMRGTEKQYGVEAYLSGRIIISEDGTLYCTDLQYYY